MYDSVFLTCKRAFDLAYYIYWASFVNVFNLNGEGYDPEAPVLPDVDLGYYLPDDVIEDFLATYLEYSGDSKTSIERITAEFNVHTTYLLFGMFLKLIQTRHAFGHGLGRQQIRNLGLVRRQMCPPNSDT